VTVNQLLYCFLLKDKVLNSSQLQNTEKVNLMDSSQIVTLHITDRLSVRAYKDCRPACLETGAIQKGLVLLLDGRELIEEGVGFGVPIAKYEDKTFFSSTADISIKETGSTCTLTKVYTLDTVSLKKFGKTSYIDDCLYSQLRKTFQILYLNHKKFTPVFNKIMELRDLANIKTEFVKVKPRGTVTITYTCKYEGIHVQADFSKLTLNKCTEVLILNEQGSNIFQKYVDSNDLMLFGNKIGAWETVKANQALLQSAHGEISFSLQNKKSATLLRGWERTRKRFSWAGLSYSMRPNTGIFDYSIGLDFKGT
jgi:hypothetical protein